MLHNKSRIKIARLRVSEEGISTVEFEGGHKKNQVTGKECRGKLILYHGTMAQARPISSHRAPLHPHRNVFSIPHPFPRLPALVLLHRRCLHVPHIVEDRPGLLAEGVQTAEALT